MLVRAYPPLGLVGLSGAGPRLEGLYATREVCCSTARESRPRHSGFKVVSMKYGVVYEALYSWVLLIDAGPKKNFLLRSARPCQPCRTDRAQECPRRW